MTLAHTTNDGGLHQGGRSDETRASILEMTYALLEKQGYKALTTDDIAAAARVSKATIYRLWRSKQALVVEAARTHFGSVDAPDLGSFRAEVHWMLEQRMRDYRDDNTLRLVAEIVGASITDPQLAELFSEWVSHFSDAIRVVIERGQVRGDVARDTPVEALVSLIAGVVARTVVAQHAFSADHVAVLVGLIEQAASPEPG